MTLRRNDKETLNTLNIKHTENTEKKRSWPLKIRPPKADWSHASLKDLLLDKLEEYMFSVI